MSARLLPALAVVVAVPLVLSGCAVGDALHHQISGTAATPAALQHDWRTPASQPDWIPADSADIRWIAATGGAADQSPASVRVATASTLPDTCTEIERQSLDSFGADWAPRKFPDRVERCGNWAVMRTDDGWFGWTPLDPDEAAE